MGEVSGTVTTATYPDVNPPYLFPGYDSTVLRSPQHRLIEAPLRWLAPRPGPDFSRIPVPPDGHDLLHRRAGEPIGERIVLAGRVLASDGSPVPGTLVEMWQANAAGVYEDPSDPGFFPHDPNFTGAGRCLTDAGGRFRFLTIKPGACPQAPGQIYRPAHIHFSVFGPTLGSRIITQCYFEGDPLIGRDPIAHATPDPRGVERLTARLDDAAMVSEGALPAMTYSHEIVLRGPAPGPDNGHPAEVATPSQTIGSRFGYALMFDGSERPAALGEAGAVEIHGQVFDGHGEPVAYPDALVELWVGDQFARTRTDTDGTYRAVLRKPAPIPLPDGRMQAPHVNVTLFARGLLKQVQTLLYFPGEAQANAADPVLALVPAERRPTLVAHCDDGALRFDIRLQGVGETAFFAV